MIIEVQALTVIGRFVEDAEASVGVAEVGLEPDKHRVTRVYVDILAIAEFFQQTARCWNGNMIKVGRYSLGRSYMYMYVLLEPQ